MRKRRLLTFYTFGAFVSVVFGEVRSAKDLGAEGERPKRGEKRRVSI